MSDVFDLDALAAEATGEPFRFRFGGEDYELPPTIDIRAVAHAQEGRLSSALRLMMTGDQWDRLERSTGRFDLPALRALFKAYGDHSGAQLGE